VSLRDQLHNEADLMEEMRDRANAAVREIAVPMIRRLIAEDADPEEMLVAVVAAIEDEFLTDATTGAMHMGASAVDKRRAAARG
jgi:hypothetical protein